MYRPEIPTKIFTILNRIGIVSKISVTKLRPNNPIKPQLIAPTIIRINAIQSTTLLSAIRVTSFKAFYLCNYINFMEEFEMVLDFYKLVLKPRREDFDTLDQLSFVQQ